MSDQVSVGSIPRPEWSPLPYPGCRNVEGKVLLVEEGLTLALLRFGLDGTIHEHAADVQVDVICLEGSGFTSIESETVEISTGQTVKWPAGKSHRLWTEETEMVTLMVERPPA